MSGGLAIYKFMGLEPTATADEVKSAYRRRARELHPDHGGDADSFKKLQKAHGILGDPVKRAKWHRDHDLPPFDGQPRPKEPRGPKTPPPWVCMACKGPGHTCAVCGLGLCDHAAFFLNGLVMCPDCRREKMRDGYGEWMLRNAFKRRRFDDLFRGL